MQEFLKKDFAKILKHNGLEGRRHMKERESTAIRVYDRSLEGLNITVDLYGPFARILDYGESPLSDIDKEEAIDIVNRYLYIEKDKIIYKTRKKREGREQHEREDESLVVEVREGGHYFKCEMLKYIDTGLFLDQAETRKKIEESSFGLKVLNLFSYTGSFSVYAASGGAESVTSVDLSNVYSTWAIENMVANGFYDKVKYPVIAEDAYAFLHRAIEEKRKWDLIIFDPPSFSNSHKAEDFDLKKDYLYYLYSFTKILSDDGIVIFSMNLGSFNLEKAKIKPYYKISELTDELRAFGFTKKKNNLRIFRLEKVKDYSGVIMRRIQDDESLEHLSLADGNEKKEKKERKEKKEEKGRKSYEKRESYSIERGSFKDRDDRPRKRFDDSDRPKRRFEDNDRPLRRFDDDRPKRYSDRKDSFRTKDGKYDDAWFEKQNKSYGRSRDDDRPRKRFEDDRPRRRFDDEERPRRRFDDERPKRRYDDERPRRKYDDSDRPKRRFDDDKPRREEVERKPRERKKPVPYGYDEFRSSKRDDNKKN